MIGSGTVLLKSAPESPRKPSAFDAGKKPGGTVQLKGTESLRRISKQRDAKTVFVAGALGSLGARIVKQLLSAGFKIRAGCASVDEAQKDLEVAVRYGIIANNASRSVSFVPIDWSDEDSVVAALGSAGKVVFTGEGGPGKACVEFIGLCEVANVTQFLLVLSPGGKSGTSFIGGSGGGSSLKQAQGVLETTNLSFTVIQPGNMGGVTEGFELNNNVVLGEKPGQVSPEQVAELISSCLINPSLAENKVLNVSTDPSADNVPYEDLLTRIKPIVTKEQQMAREAEKARLKQDISNLGDQIVQLESEEEDAKERMVAYKEKIKELQSTQREKQTEASSMLRSTSKVERQLGTLTRQVTEQGTEEAVARALYAAAQKAQRNGRLLTRDEERDIEFAVVNPEAAAQKAAEEEQRRIEEEEAEAAAAKAAQEKEEKIKAEAKRKEEEAKKAEEKAAKIKAEKEAQAAKAKAEKEAKAKAAAKEKKKQEAEAAAAKANKEREEQLAIEAKKREEEEKKKAEEAARVKAAEEEKKRQEEMAAKAAADVKEKEEEAKKAEIEAAKKKAEEEAAAAKAAKEEKARLAAEAKKKEIEARKAKAEAARQKKQQEAKARAAARQAGGGFGLFGSWKAPWNTSSSATDGDRPTAREWIEAWRRRQRGEITAEEWIDNWRAKQPTKTK